MPDSSSFPATARQLNPVSSKLVKARFIASLPFPIIALIAFIVMGLLVSPWFYIGAGLTGLFLIWLLWLIPAQVKKMGWLETPDELLLSRGKIWHTYTVVPYGRIQFVDVHAGPVAKAYGLKSVLLHTASSTSDSKIHGLEAETADALRDRLAVQARERMSGL